jgi:5-methylcytosine-specific restriction endonuclease McrA
VAENKALRAKLKPINRKRLIKSRGDKCEWCGDSKHDLELHHIVRVIDGGTNAEDNLLVLCSICHHSLAHRGEMANNR